jgi:tRNA pseudouridine55 synthase
VELHLWRVPGLFVVNKPAGPSSFGVIRAARRELGVRKIGHAGTLDPMASGVLILGVGRGTKLLATFSDADKAYRVSLRLGEKTDTFDTTGTTVLRRDASGLDRATFDAVIARFRGEIQQVPPMFSALKRDGTPLYKLARKGVEVEREPRRVLISSIDVVSFEPPDAVLDVACSKGTYVRSLVDDIGEALSCGAVMTALMRTRVGPFCIEEARDLGSLLAES